MGGGAAAAEKFTRSLEGVGGGWVGGWVGEEVSAAAEIAEADMLQTPVLLAVSHVITGFIVSRWVPHIAGFVTKPAYRHLAAAAVDQAESCSMGTCT
jgi:hypothetical protein